MNCCKTMLEVLSCSSYKGRIGGSSTEEKVSRAPLPVALAASACRAAAISSVGPLCPVKTRWLARPNHVQVPCVWCW